MSSIVVDGDDCEMVVRMVRMMMLVVMAILMIVIVMVTIALVMLGIVVMIIVDSNADDFVGKNFQMDSMNISAGVLIREGQVVREGPKMVGFICISSTPRYPIIVLMVVLLEFKQTLLSI